MAIAGGCVTPDSIKSRIRADIQHVMLLDMGAEERVDDLIPSRLRGEFAYVQF